MMMHRLCVDYRTRRDREMSHISVFYRINDFAIVIDILIQDKRRTRNAQNDVGKFSLERFRFPELAGNGQLAA